MWPVALSVGPLYISTFGVSLAMGFLLASFFLYRQVKDDLEISPELVFDAIAVAMLGAILGARIWYIVFHQSEFGNSHILYFLFRERPGLSFSGGLIGGLLFLLAFTISKKISLFRLLDIATIPYLWAFTIGQLGSLFDGFSYGQPTQYPWGVSLFGSAERYHPLPLYKVLFSLFLLVCIRVIQRATTRKKAAHGLFFLLVFALQLLFTTLVDFGRSDIVRVNGFAVEQMFLLTVGLVLLGYGYYRMRRIQSDLKLTLAFGAKIGQNIERTVRSRFYKKHETSQKHS